MKMKTLIKSSMWLVAAGLLTACASEETQQKPETKQPETKYVATFTGHQPKVTAPAKSRTTATYTIGNPAQVLWEATDKIWVKADDGNFYQSEAANFAASATPTDHSRANFNLTTGSYMKFNPEVRYTGASTDANTVVIASTQSQGAPNNFSHLGTAGDCGTAIAQGGGNDHEFTLQHKASYLCFLPRCMNTQLGPNINLTKITVTADKDIAGTYDFSNGSLMGKTPTGGSKSITLTLDGGNGLTLNTTTANLSMNGAYMVIAPGTYNLTITYTIVDPIMSTSFDITKTEAGYTCPEGQIRDITANLTPPSLPLTLPKYYMWDAQQDYWWGHEATQFYHFPLGEGWAQYKYQSPERWHNDSYPGAGLRYDAQTTLFKSLPNVNELLWYAKYGDPHKERNIFAGVVYGHLITYHGLWLRKKSVILAYLKAHGYPASLTEADLKEAYWETPTDPHKDCRVGSNVSYRYAVTFGRPANTADYFFLPLTGIYLSGSLKVLGVGGSYWSSSAAPNKDDLYLTAYSFNCFDGNIIVDARIRKLGMQARPFE